MGESLSLASLINRKGSIVSSVRIADLVRVNKGCRDYCQCLDCKSVTTLLKKLTQVNIKIRRARGVGENGISAIKATNLASLKENKEEVKRKSEVEKKLKLMTTVQEVERVINPEEYVSEVKNYKSDTMYATSKNIKISAFYNWRRKHIDEINRLLGVEPKAGVDNAELSAMSKEIESLREQLNHSQKELEKSQKSCEEMVDVMGDALSRVEKQLLESRERVKELENEQKSTLSIKVLEKTEHWLSIDMDTVYESYQQNKDIRTLEELEKIIEMLKEVNDAKKEVVVIGRV